ncbi:MAG: tetratricopeptide repeat protein [Oscillospiraceae bacterium]|nr:tetratricopeptide repeat protein [Oscillospiraceae bacterium]
MTHGWPRFAVVIILSSIIAAPCGDRALAEPARASIPALPVSAKEIIPDDLSDKFELAQNADDPQSALALLIEIVSAPDVSNELIRECLNWAWSNADFSDEPMLALLQAVAALDRPALDAERYPLVVMLFLMGQTDEAKRMLDERISRSPEDVDARVDQAQALYEYAAPEEALAALDDSLAKFPDSSDLWIIRGWTLEQVFRFDEAIDSMRRAVEIERNNDDDTSFTYYHLFLTASRAGRFEEASRALDRVISEVGAEDLFLKRAAYRLWDLFDPDAALKDLNALISQNPKLAEAYHLRLFARLWAEEFEGAIADANALAELVPSAGPLMLGIAQMYAGELSQSRANITEYINAHPDDPAGYIYRAMLALYREDDAEAARADLDAASVISNENVDAQRILAAIYERMGNWSAAADAYALAADWTDEDASPLEELALLFLAQGREVDARTVVEEMKRIYPGQYQTLRIEMQTLIAEGDIERAFAIFEEIERIFPYMADRGARTGAALLALQGRAEEAISILAEHPPTSPADYGDAAFVNILAGDIDEASRLLADGDAAIEEAALAPAIERATRIALLITSAEMEYASGDLEKCVSIMREACALGWYPLEALGSWVMGGIEEFEGYRVLLGEFPVK